MPGYKTHLVGGAAAGIGGLFAARSLGLIDPTPLTSACLVGVSALAALFPDTDTDSKGQNLFYLLLLAGDIGLIAARQYLWAAILGLVAILPGIGRHRGWTHTLAAAVAVPLPIVLVPLMGFSIPPATTLPIYAAAVTGYLSHLLLDRQLRLF